ncbi:unnamed protein product [Staurois parvus]|uniref:Uncharacterized protein n=1 Tax=Staurois parvus TaxID=386267 RepID=A0ABN9BBC9_9NEOB|nr:unnamed protein product [Staurois parvus]
MSTVSDHLLYHVSSLRPSILSCLQSLTISYIMSVVSDHLFYHFHSL